MFHVRHPLDQYEAMNVAAPYMQVQSVSKCDNPASTTATQCGNISNSKATLQDRGHKTVASGHPQPGP